MTQARKKTLTWNPIGSAASEAPHEPGDQEAVVQALVGRQRRRFVGERLRRAERLQPPRRPPQEHLEDDDVDVDRRHDGDEEGGDGGHRRSIRERSTDVNGRRAAASCSASTRSNSVQRTFGQVELANIGSFAASCRRTARSPSCVDVATLFALLGNGHDRDLRLRFRRVDDAARTLRMRQPGRAQRYSRLTRSVRYHCVRCRPPSRPQIRGSWRCPPPRSAAGSSSSSPSAGTRHRAQREPRPGGRRHAALHEFRDGPVQGRPDRSRDAVVHAERSTTSAACASRASTTTSRRSAGRRATTPSSRCSATGASATTSSARRSTGRGTS